MKEPNIRFAHTFVITDEFLSKIPAASEWRAFKKGEAMTSLGRLIGNKKPDIWHSFHDEERGEEQYDAVFYVFTADELKHYVKSKMEGRI